MTMNHSPWPLRPLPSLGVPPATIIHLHAASTRRQNVYFVAQCTLIPWFGGRHTPFLTCKAQLENVFLWST